MKNYRDTMIRHCFSLLSQERRGSLLNSLRKSKIPYIITYDRVIKSYVIWLPEEARVERKDYENQKWFRK